MDARPFVVRVPRKAVFAAIWVALIFGGLELRQRILDARKWGPRNEGPYSVRFETASGFAFDPEQRGRIALAHDPATVYANRPGQRTPCAAINSLGFRGAEWVAPKPAGRLRVIVVGGSTAFGFGAERDEELFTARLERDLRAEGSLAGRDVEVLDAGVLGFDSEQELLLVAARLLDREADVFVFVDGWNDLNGAGRAPQGARDLTQPWFHAIDRHVEEAARPWLALLRGSAFFRRFEELVHDAAVRRQERRFGDFADNLDAAVARYSANLRKSAAVAGSFGARVVLVAQPELFLRGGALPQDEEPLRAKYGEGGWREYARAGYPRFVAAARAVAAASGARFVDGTTAFDASADVAFLDRCHLTARGNELLGDALAPAVGAALLER